MKSLVLGKRGKSGWLFGTLIGLLLLLASAAPAFICTTHISSDAQLEAIIKDLAVIASGRYVSYTDATSIQVVDSCELSLGDNFEYPAVTEDFTWPNDTDIVLALTYDKECNTVYFRIGDKTLEFQPCKPFTDIFIRTVALQEETEAEVEDLSFNGVNIGDSSYAYGPDGTDILWIKGNSLPLLNCGGLSENSFALVGETELAWPEVERLVQDGVSDDLGFQIILATINDPCIDVDKYVYPTCAKRGEKVKYTFEVSNEGAFPLSCVTVCDDLLGDLTQYFIDANYGCDTLDVGQEVEFCVEYCVPSCAPDVITNEVTVKGIDEDCRVACDTACATLTVTGTVGSAYKPDAIIYNVGDWYPYGKNIYNTTCVNQTATQSIARGCKATFCPRIENDGVSVDSLLVTSTCNKSGWTVKWSNALNGGSDITSLVKGSGWCVTNLSPNGVGARDFKLEVTVPTNATVGDKCEIIMKVTSKNDPTKYDVVKAIVIVK